MVPPKPMKKKKKKKTAGQKTTSHEPSKPQVVLQPALREWQEQFALEAMKRMKKQAQKSKTQATSKKRKVAGAAKEPASHEETVKRQKNKVEDVKGTGVATVSNIAEHEIDPSAEGKKPVEDKAGDKLVENQVNVKENEDSCRDLVQFQAAYKWSASDSNLEVCLQVASEENDMFGMAIQCSPPDFGTLQSRPRLYIPLVSGKSKPGVHPDLGLANSQSPNSQSQNSKIQISQIAKFLTSRIPKSPQNLYLPYIILILL